VDLEAPHGVSTADLAQLFDCSARQIQRLATEGIVVRLGRGRFDAEASTANYIRSLRQTAAGRAHDNDVALTEERALLAREQRVGHEIKNALARAELVEIEEVGRQVEAQYSTVRERLLAIPGKCASALVGADHQKIEDILFDEINDALRELHAGSIADRAGGVAAPPAGGTDGAAPGAEPQSD
jgi:phage terminase Nu1 subunit (DNA packaging protein)